TTKGAEGTGLGLTVVRNVMHRHGGTVRLEDTGHRGARFVLAFPLKRPS
ncbi:MAG: HAMP domain-containing histidine kinase, partial [Candidatus Hydrogenedentes bacterium]|nr:HAMP domain-containing histidine kinase [Candidatus Hydrogenedentota bacterium]